MDDYAEAVVKMQKSISLLHYHFALREFDAAMQLLGTMEWAVRELKDFCVAHQSIDRYRMLHAPLDIDLGKPL